MIPRAKIRKITRRIGLGRYSAVHLLGTLILFIVLLPFVDSIPNVGFLEPVLLTLVLVFALLAVGGRRKILVIGLLLLLPAIFARWANHMEIHLVSPAAFVGFGLLFIAFVVANIFRYIQRASRVDADVVCAGISIYLLIGLMWAMAYRLLGMVTPDAFYFANVQDPEKTMTSFNSFYFSLSTLSSVGYGDITPLSKAARMLAVMETISGILYVTVLISRLVSLYSPKAPQSDNES